MVLVVTLLSAVGAPVRAQETATLTTAAEARAAIAGAQSDLDDALAQTTVDCAVACTALASMQRSAERLCELEPGPRCDEVRERVETARGRVAERCPTCEALREAAGPKQPASDPHPEPPPGNDRIEVDDDKPKPKAASATTKSKDDEPLQSVAVTGESASSPAGAPPSEESTGGCAACHLGGANDPRGLWALALAGLALALRRR